MKPLLRAVLIVDAGLYLSSGAALLLSPIAGVQRTLQLTPIEPAMAGQMLGLALLGLAWLALRGAFDGAMTIGVAKIVGHVTWLAGALVLAWTLGPHKLWLPALGIVPNLLIGGLLIVVGLGGARFAGAVRRREIDKAAQAAGNGAKGKGKGRGATAEPAASASSASGAPEEPVLRPAERSDAGASGAGIPPRTERQVERPFAPSSEPGVRGADGASASARAGAASGGDDVRASRSASAPRPPFHG
ncbi:hypothetical protein [Trinickia dinghuensis]|uniref:Uncharacterized protein n=1 Tax=Trinickia dinghuensis TaxID=2291023 RepID=A0A3D8K2N5_9BURK|nr:hypothetical protein [Trinickia dinghuensis]RDU99578.1 hypothetical protein DWV00_08010 [Trinickia dinghuensis]